MIKMLTAVTREIDDVDKVCVEILAQLDLTHNKLKNAVGIITCESEFIDAGAVAELCKRLPFDTIGITTAGSAACGQYGVELLTIAVLTSDDVRFSAVVSEPVSAGNIEKPLRAAYKRACSKYKGRPSLVIAHPPLMMNLGTGPFVSALCKICENVPIFGSLSCDGTVGCANSSTIYNGAAWTDALVMIAFFGEVNPRFFVASIPVEEQQKQFATITESEGYIVKKMNGMKIAKFFETMGIPPESIAKAYAVPMMVDFKDGSPAVARTLFSFTKEGGAVFGGDMPEGTIISIGNLNYNTVLETVQQGLDKIVKEKSGSVLMYSCFSRNIALKARANDELKKIADTLDNKFSYQASYAGGEICPTTTEGRPVNRLHNYTFVACVL
jgi:hypothetical protein